MKNEALKLALEAAYLAGFNASGEGYNGEYPFQDHNAHPEQDTGWVRGRDNKLSAIKQALAAPVQEPVAWMYPDDYERMLTSETFCTVYSVEVGSATRGESSVALYTTPPAAQRQWVGLTEQEAAECWSTDTVRTWQAIEAKLKEKNNG
jgi:hypothetical protein